MWIKADLHIHTCLSPCGDLLMSPKNIVKKAEEKGLQIIAITDHNCADNIPAFFDVCKDSAIVPLGGIEVTSIEEVHVLAIFETERAAVEFGKVVYDSLPSIKNIPEKFGDQVVVDKDENIIEEKEKYLVSATQLSIEEIYQLIKKHNGLFIPAHIDKPVFSLISQLGFVPDLPYDALEVTKNSEESFNCSKIANSDAHYLDNIADRFFLFEADEINFTSLKNALKERRIKINLK